MAASQSSFRSREFGSGSNNFAAGPTGSLKKAAQMEENDVFYSAADNVPSIGGKGGLGNGVRRVQALGDSSNSLKKSKSGGLGNFNRFGFQKPTPLPSKKQTTRSVNTAEDFSNNKYASCTKVRSSSVPVEKSLLDNQQIKEEFNDFHDFGDDWYPEPEYLRDISEQAFFHDVISPIEINWDETNEITRNEDDLIGVWENEIDSAQEEDDLNYPEIEKLPASYTTQTMDDPIWFRMRDMHICCEKDDPTISKPPKLEFDLEGHSSFISNYLSDIQESVDCDSFYVESTSP